MLPVETVCSHQKSLHKSCADTSFCQHRDRAARRLNTSRKVSMSKLGKSITSSRLTRTLSGWVDGCLFFSESLPDCPLPIFLCFYTEAAEPTFWNSADVIGASAQCLSASSWKCHRWQGTHYLLSLVNSLILPYVISSKKKPLHLCVSCSSLPTLHRSGGEQCFPHPLFFKWDQRRENTSNNNESLPGVSESNGNYGAILTWDYCIGVF